MGESAARAIGIPRSFAVSRFEITFAQWDACAADGGCTHKPPDNDWGRANRPVMNVNWHDASNTRHGCLEKAGKSIDCSPRRSGNMRARAGTNTAYYWGSDDTNICQYASVRTESSVRMAVEATRPRLSAKGNPTRSGSMTCWATLQNGRKTAGNERWMACPRMAVRAPTEIAVCTCHAAALIC